MKKLKNRRQPIFDEKFRKIVNDPTPFASTQMPDKIPIVCIVIFIQNTAGSRI